MGAYVLWDILYGWMVREIDVREMAWIQTLPALIEYPENTREAMKRIGNAEPSRMAQSLARSVIRPYLEASSGAEIDMEAPTPTPWRTQDPWELTESPLSPAMSHEASKFARSKGQRRAQWAEKPIPSVQYEQKPIARNPRNEPHGGAANRWDSREAKWNRGDKEGWYQSIKNADGRDVQREQSTTTKQLLEQTASKLEKLTMGKTVAQMGKKTASDTAGTPAWTSRNRHKAMKEDPVLKKTRVVVEGAARSVRTTTKYTGNWIEYLAFCVDLEEEDPFMKGKSKELQELLIHFALERYHYYGNKHGTIRNYMYGIRWHFLAESLECPLKGKPRLDIVLEGIKKLNGAISRKEPITVEMVTDIWIEAIKSRDVKIIGIGVAVVLAFFFMLRVGEFAAQDQKTWIEYILLREQLKFYKKGKEVAWHEEPDEIGLHCSGEKVSSEPWFRNHFTTGQELCPVKAAVLWFSLTAHKVAASAPLFMIPAENQTQKGAMLTRMDIARAVTAAAIKNGQKGASFGSHSLRIGGATALLRCGASSDVVKLLGRWKSDAFRIYTRHTRAVMTGVARDMCSTVLGYTGAIEAGAMAVR
jgi:hypothetical protein